MAPAEKRFGLLERITRMIGESHDYRGTVDNIVSLVKNEMDTDVCSLYMYDEERNVLSLAATEGLDPESIGRVEMKPSEGLTGLVFETKTPLVVQNADKHPRFKYFPVTREEHFQTFLGVPLISRRSPIGVLVVQDKKERNYSTQEIQLFTTIAGQVASVAVNARLLSELSTGSTLEAFDPLPVPVRTILHGTAAAPGIAMGRAIVLDTSEEYHYIVEERTEDAEGELKSFAEALEKAREQIVHLQDSIRQQLGDEDAAIFNIHLMMLEDKGFSQKVEDLIKRGYTAMYSVKSVISGYRKSFAEIDDPYLRDRVVDIEDIGRRMVTILSGAAPGDSRQAAREGILVSNLITPSDTAHLTEQQITGIATAGGGHTSHAIILSRSLGIPCVVGLDEILDVVHPGDFLIVDGNTGNVFINPEEEVINEFKRITEEYSRFVVELVREKDLPAETLDGYRVELMANVGLLSDLKLVHFYGATGIGLYRTELPFIARNTLPTEDEQYRIYRRMIEGAKGKVVTIRTLDIGGDKNIPYLKFPPEENPFLGLRSIRMCLEKQDVFKVQLRAVLRAARHGKAQLLIPMISSMEEVIKVKAIISETVQELEKTKVPFNSKVPLGIMVEIPSAAHLARKIAREVDFFSIGTNDLIQYTLAVDRNNKKVAHLYNPMNPAVLNLIYMTSRAAKEAGIPVAVCGEVAADPLWTPMLIGLGINEFSMNAAAIPLVKRAVRLIKQEDALRAARRALKAGTTAEVRRILTRFEHLITTEILYSP
ncbi:MAG: phosphoenolpyruvate--protein phosphotransferase [bacterium]